MKYATIDNTGKVIAFYDKQVHGDIIPDTAIEISDEQWQEYLSSQHIKRFKDGKIITRVKELKELKEEKLAEIQFRKSQKLSESISYKGKTIDIDESFLSKAKNALDKSPKRKIKKTGIGSLDYAAIIDLLDLIEEKTLNAYTREADLIEEVETAKTIEELDAIDLDSGW